jgi:hypothetical protein
MANIHATTTATVTLTSAPSFRITVNGTLAGTITVTDSTGVLAVITNPTVGSFFDYSHAVGNVTIVPSATCDITVTTNIRGVR